MDKNFTNNEEILVAYLDGTLLAEEKNRVEQQLNADKNFQAQYESLLLAKESIRQFGLKKQVAGIHQKVMAEMQTTPVHSISRVRKISRFVATAAAAILLMIAGYWFFNSAPASAEKVFAANYSTYELPTVRDSGTETAIEKAYRANDYKGVIQLAETTQNNAAQTYFLAGVSAIELKNADKAVSYFINLLALNKKNAQTVYNDEAEYFLSMAYIQQGSYKQAYSLLQKIKNEVAHKYNQLVTDKLMSQVNKLMKN
jgi:tetratricopeptide (TPR) repeat protein